MPTRDHPYDRSENEHDLDCVFFSNTNHFTSSKERFNFNRQQLIRVQAFRCRLRRYVIHQSVFISIASVLIKSFEELKIFTIYFLAPFLWFSSLGFIFLFTSFFYFFNFSIILLSSGAFARILCKKKTIDFNDWFFFLSQ